MSDYIKEKIKEFEKILNTNANEPKYGKHWQMRQDYILQIELPRFLKSSLQEMEEKTREEEREKIERLRDEYRLKHPAMPNMPIPSSLRKSYQDLTDPFVSACNSILASLSLSEEKDESGEKECECNAPCYCHCHCNKKIMCGHAGEYSCQHCSPKKEKRGR